MPSNRPIFCLPLLLLPPIFPSIRVFCSELALCIRWPKYWSFNFTVIPSNEYSGLISFRIEWFDLLAVQGVSLESSPTPQFKSISSSAFSLLYGPTPVSIHTWLLEKPYTIQTFVSKVMSLLFDMPSRFVIAFLPRSKCLSILWLQPPSAVILDPKKIKSVNVSYVLKIYIKMFTEGLPWWSSDWDSELLMQGPQVWSLVGRLDPAHHNRKTPRVTTKIQCNQEIK